MMEELKSRFLDLKEIDKYQRIASSHPVAWFIGLDGHNRYSLFVITKSPPKKIYSTNIMDVFIGKRRDGDFGITFSLLEKKNLDIFVHFCEDLVTYTKSIIQPEQVADRICFRYLQWQRAFIKTNGKLLSYEQIKGLIGELCFLQMKMIPSIGPEKALESWSGIEATDQDFSCDETWYEIKTTVSGAASVKISSIEQLDVSTVGHLVVISLDKTSKADTSKLTLNSMVQLVLDTIPSKLVQDDFRNRLLDFGYYYDKEYDQFGFKYNGMSIYTVDSNFPCLRKSGIPVSIQNARYELSLAAIDSFKEE